MNPDIDHKDGATKSQQQLFDLAKDGITDAKLTTEQTSRLLERGKVFRQLVGELAKTCSQSEYELQQQQQQSPPVAAIPVANMDSYDDLHDDMYGVGRNKDSWWSENYEWVAPLGVVVLFIALTIGVGVCLSTSKTSAVTKASSSPAPEQAATPVVSVSLAGFVRTFQSRVRFRNQSDDNPSMVEITVQWQVPGNLLAEKRNIARKIEMTATAAATAVATEYASGEANQTLNQAIKYEFSKQWRKIVKLQPQSPLANCQPIITDVRTK